MAHKFSGKVDKEWIFEERDKGHFICRSRAGTKNQFNQSKAGWPLVMEIMEIMEKSWNFFWSWKKSWSSKKLPNSHGKVMEVFL